MTATFKPTRSPPPWVVMRNERRRKTGGLEVALDAAYFKVEREVGSKASFAMKSGV